MPPHILLLRGTATVEVVDGLVPEWLEASRRHMARRLYPDFEAQSRELYERWSGS